MLLTSTRARAQPPSPHDARRNLSPPSPASHARAHTRTHRDRHARTHTHTQSHTYTNTQRAFNWTSQHRDMERLEATLAEELKHNHCSFPPPLLLIFPVPADILSACSRAIASAAFRSLAPPVSLSPPPRTDARKGRSIEQGRGSMKVVKLGGVRVCRVRACGFDRVGH